MSDRQAMLARIDSLVGDVEHLKERAGRLMHEAENLEQQAAYKRELHDQTYAEIRRTNGEIDRLIKEMRGY